MRPLTSCLFLLVFLSSGCDASQASVQSAEQLSEPMRFEFPRAPKQIVLRFSPWGPIRTENPASIEVYADGQVWKGGRSAEQYGQLANGQLQELFGLLSEYGLLELDEQALLTSLEQRLGSDPLRWGLDVDRIEIEFHVADRIKGGVRLGGLDRKLRLYGPGMFHRMYPDIKPLEGVVKLDRWLRDLEQ